MRLTWNLLVAAAPLAIAAALAPAPARADSTPECNANAGPDGIAGNGDDLDATTECGVSSTASGAGGTAIGFSSTASGASSTASGWYSIASGIGSTAIGEKSNAGGFSSTAIGALSKASGDLSAALGELSNASGQGSIALGTGSEASAANSVALGANSLADQANTVSVGSGSLKRRVINVADGTLAAGSKDAVTGGQLYTTNQNVAAAQSTANTALAATSDSIYLDNQNTGPAASATGTDALAVGASSQASGAGSTTSGVSSTASGDYSVASGDFTHAVGLNSVAIGGGDGTAGNPGAVAYDDHDIAIGGNSVAGIDSTSGFYGNQTDDTAIGYGAQATGGRSTATGSGAVASRAYSSTYGTNSAASGIQSSAYGYSSTASGDYGAAFGNSATASGAATAAFGDSAYAIGDYSSAYGTYATARGDHSEAFGIYAATHNTGDVAIGASSVAGVDPTDATYDSQQWDTAVGNVARATGGYSAAFGEQSTASGGGSSAYGAESRATGDESSAYGANSLAGGNYGTASGAYARALSDYAFAGGSGASASGAYSVAIGGGNGLPGSAPATTYDDHDIAIGGTSIAGVDPADASYAGQTDDIALGYGALATGGNAVALGKGSIADIADTVSVGAAGSERRIVNVAAGTIGAGSTDAVNGSQLYTTNQNVAALQSQIAGGGGGAGLVLQAGAAQPVTVAAATGGTVVDVTGTDGARTITGVATGTLGAASADAVNGSQLYATNQNVTTNATAITASATDISTTNQRIAAALGGGAGVDGAGLLTPPSYSVQGGSYSSVAGAFGALDTQMTANTSAITTLQGQIAGGGGGGGGGGGLVAQAGAGQPVTVAAATGGTVVDVTGTDGARQVTGVADGMVAAGSTDAVNGAQLAATNQQVTTNSGAITSNTANIANNTTAISTLADGVANGSVGPVRYADSGTPATPNGGTQTNDLTLVGAKPGAVGLHNVGDGTIAAGSTDAVNGGQIYKLALTAVNAVSYDTDAKGNRTNTLTLAGGNAEAPVTIRNVAAGAVSAESTEAVNGGQLYQTNQAFASAQDTADNALALGQNSVQYDDESHSEVTLGNAEGGPVAVHNVAAGVDDTDAVNVAQLNSGLDAAVSQANAYTDSRLLTLNYDLRAVRRNANAGTANALAAAGLPQAYEPGKGMIALAGGTYQGQSAIAFGFSEAFSDEHTVIKASASYDSRGKAGASIGMGYQF